jgi:hypothetical protein
MLVDRDGFVTFDFLGELVEEFDFDFLAGFGVDGEDELAVHNRVSHWGNSIHLLSFIGAVCPKY